jgi:molybdenum cofactor guanylyltransferase
MTREHQQNIPTWPHTGAILAGGQSTRMGEPKEGVCLWDNRPMIEHVLETLRSVCSQVIIVGECKGFSIPEGASICKIEDNYPGIGPISGLEALLSSGLDSQYLVTCCDQPLLTTDLLIQLIENEPSNIRLFSSPSQDKLDPFPGIYPVSVLPVLHDQLKQGQYSMQRFLKNSPVTFLPLDESDLIKIKSINSKADLALINSEFPI